MMNTQQSTFLGSASRDALRELPAGHVVALGSGGGEVSILSGGVWLTSAGDPSDHFLAAGESFRVRDSGETLVETWSGRAPALIAWQPRSLLARIHDRFARSCERCWELMNPLGRVGIGSVAAVAAILAAGLLFGPVSEARVRNFAGPAVTGAVLHNATDRAVGATAMRGSPGDGSDTGERAGASAQEARRRAAGAA